VACEVVEAWYRATTTTKGELHHWYDLSPQAAEKRVCKNASLVGLDPAAVLRELSLSINVEWLFLVFTRAENGKDQNTDAALRAEAWIR
jgi:hypothetical protein